MTDVILEILVEEQSMEVFLRGLLPDVLPAGFVLDINCFVRPHQGKQDLQQKLPQNVRAYKHYHKPVILMVIQDQDSADCKELKNKLVRSISENNPNLIYLVRIACRELENWYLGDLDAVEMIYPKSKATRMKNKAKFRNPDLLNGSDEMRKLTDDFTKVGCARRISGQINKTTNSSNSFMHFIRGLSKLLAEENLP